MGKTQAAKRTAAINMLREGVPFKDVLKTLDITAADVLHWQYGMLYGEEHHENPGHPKLPEFKYMRLVKYVFRAAYNPYAAPTPFLAPISKQLALKRLNRYGFNYKSPSVLWHWLDALGWTGNRIPRQFVADYCDYVAALDDESIELLARNKLTIAAQNIHFYHDECPVKHWEFALVPPDPGEDIGDGIIVRHANHKFSNTVPFSLPPDPWDGAPLAPGLVGKYRATLRTNAKFHCVELFANSLTCVCETKHKWKK